MAYNFELLTVETSGRVATVIIDNLPAMSSPSKK